jgi:HSP20 family protein
MVESFMGGSLLSPAQRRSGVAQVWMPPVEITQKGDNLVILADIPGVKKDELDVQIKEGMLTIEGDRREEFEEETGGFKRSERRYGHFYRAIQLPENVDTEKVEASMHDGVLEITIPAPTRQQGRRLEIRG